MCSERPFCYTCSGDGWTVDWPWSMINDWKGNSKIGNDCTNHQELRHNNYSFKQLEMQICVIEFMGLHLLFSLRCECKYVWIITALQPPRLRIATIPWSDPATTTSTSLCTKENQLPSLLHPWVRRGDWFDFLNRRWNPSVREQDASEMCSKCFGAIP